MIRISYGSLGFKMAIKRLGGENVYSPKIYKSENANDFDTRFLKSLHGLEEKIIEDINTDNAIDADPYDNVARLKTCEKIEKIYLRLKKECGDEYV